MDIVPVALIVVTLVVEFAGKAVGDLAGNVCGHLLDIAVVLKEGTGDVQRQVGAVDHALEQQQEFGNDFLDIVGYEHLIVVQLDYAFAGSEFVLDLGEVKNLAAITVNNREYPVLWRKPFRLDVTDSWKSENEISIRVTTLWPNRLIGDELLPLDCNWRGYSLAEIPDWVKKGERSPTGRHTFTTHYHWRKRDNHKLFPSGLIGPVKRIVLSSSPIR
jgi:hypothetical protein